jgi:hypothetical protein
MEEAIDCRDENQAIGGRGRKRSVDRLKCKEELKTNNVLLTLSEVWASAEEMRREMTRRSGDFISRVCREHATRVRTRICTRNE